MSKPCELLNKMLFEANNAENTAETRRNCREAADYLESVVLLNVRPKLIRIPFSWYFVAVCGRCNGELHTEEDTCEHCGCKIDWKAVLCEPKKTRRQR